jgi:hypothetical protein
VAVQLVEKVHHGAVTLFKTPFAQSQVVISVIEPNVNLEILSSCSKIFSCLILSLYVQKSTTSSVHSNSFSIQSLFLTKNLPVSE